MTCYNTQGAASAQTASVAAGSQIGFTARASISHPSVSHGQCNTLVTCFEDFVFCRLPTSTWQRLLEPLLTLPEPETSGSRFGNNLRLPMEDSQLLSPLKVGYYSHYVMPLLIGSKGRHNSPSPSRRTPPLESKLARNIYGSLLISSPDISSV